MKTKKTKAEIIDYIIAQEKQHWESLKRYEKVLGLDDKGVETERARWNVYYMLLDFINS